ncbi:L-threonylcarbamoyladenylate synthase type 1 TsaC, partial [Streptomyces sp. NP160]
ISETIQKYSEKRIGVLAFSKSSDHDAVAFQIVLSESTDLQEAASKLYDALHQLDKQDLDIIIAERFPDIELGKSIND